MQTFEWAIEDIFTAHPALSLQHAAAMAVALMHPIGQPCRFPVHVDGLTLDQLGGESEFVLSVNWKAETEGLAEKMLRTEQRTPIIERAAIGLAALLLAHLAFDPEMVVMKQTERADFWLPTKQQAVEISGTEHARELPRRRREKRLQVLANPFAADGHVIICCFEHGRALIQWDFHTQVE